MNERYVCTNCGFWQQGFQLPRTCPVCTDFRHTPPDDAWEFLTFDEAAARYRTTWREDDGVWVFETLPKLGIGPSGYLIPRGANQRARTDARAGEMTNNNLANSESTNGETANARDGASKPNEGAGIFFESCGFYSPDALDFIESRGGIACWSASHPHAYGASWQLHERFAPEVAIHVADLGWTNALAVSHPFDERLQLAPGAELLHTGGHFDGHCVLYLRDERVLFAGDTLKFHFAQARFEGISTHKAFNRGIPMSHGEIRRYRAVVGELSWKRIYSTFERGPDDCRDLALRLFDAQLNGKPFFGPLLVE